MAAGKRARGTMRRRAKVSGEPRARRANGSKTRKHVLDVAERLFAAEGYSGVGMRRIAVEADVNVALPYYYFETKQKLYAEIVSRFSGGLGEALGALLDPSLEPGQRLDAAVDLLFDVLRGNVRFAQILIREVMRPSRAWLRASRQQIGPVLEGVDALLARGAEAGRIARADGVVLSLVVFGAVAYWVVAHRSLRALLGADPLRPPLLDRARAEVKAMLRARLDLGERS